MPAALTNLLYALQGAFTLWMLWDCVQRRAESHWYAAVLTPIGAWVYFFAVKIYDYDWRWLARLLNPPPSLAHLRYRARETPSVSNRLVLADALLAARAFTEARETYDLVLGVDPTDLAALHGRGRCALASGEFALAIDDLTHVTQREFGFREHRAVLDLADALAADARDDDAVALLEDLVRTSPSLPHRLALARRYLAVSRPLEAREVLDRALDDHRHAPGYVRRRDGRAARAARRLRRELGPSR